MLTQVVGCQDGPGTLGRGDRISAPYRWVSSIQVRGLDLDIADALFVGQPILPGK